ncbi:hypothetical protein HK098_007444 [Nowakowskiella sp. JEL0407]|nr:hypothetical protein HK098_007444 [Nowakowskiella sp. JEL0407]
MCGEDADFDVADLRKHARYEGGYFDQHATIRAFWQVLADLEPKEKKAFLKFVTSCSKPPVGGFQHLTPPLTIRFVTEEVSAEENQSVHIRQVFGSMFGIGKDKTRLPTSSTCFNLLKLPAYKKKSTLKEKLRYAINSGTGFELS